MMKNFDHLVRINSETSDLEIYRVFPDGKQDLLTKTSLPEGESDSKIEEFSRLLGENILMDNPISRSKLYFD